MKTKNKRCPLPFLLLLAVLWFVQSIQPWLSEHLPERELALVETTEPAYIQIYPLAGADYRDEIWKEINTP